MCLSKALSENGKTLITHCETCDNYYIWQQSYLLTFDLQQYRSFAQRILKRKGSEEFIQFPDGKSRLVLYTPLLELSLTFTYSEWNDLILCIEESNYMLQVYQLMEGF